VDVRKARYNMCHRKASFVLWKGMCESNNVKVGEERLIVARAKTGPFPTHPHYLHAT
jgi:hypothetical protein